MFKINKCKLFMKKCSKCGQIKILKNFGKDKHGKFGLKYICKVCEKTKYKKICPNCNEEFFTGTKSQICCSKQCRGEYDRRNNNIFCKCDICGKGLELTSYSYNRSEHHYCSIKCMGKGESKFHVGENAKNFKNATIKYKCDICGQESSQLQGEYNKYQHHYCSYECKCKGQTKFYSGENSKKYKEYALHDTRQSETIGYTVFIKEVMERDKYTCRCCGRYKEVSGKLNVHHLQGYHWCKEKRTDKGNALTLCEDCHSEFHSIYGKGNNTKEQFIEYLNNKFNKVM